VELTKVMNEEAIALSLEAFSREEVVRQLAKILQRLGAVSDVETYLVHVEEREQMGSTAIGLDVAIPHAKSDAAVRPAVAFARLAHPIHWHVGEEETVRLVFLIAVPLEQAGNEHLQILAALSRKLMQDAVRERLLQARTEEEVIKVLS
jgi:fructose PTS system EIIA component